MRTEAPPTVVAEALRRAATVNAYFAIRLEPTPDDWRPHTDLVAGLLPLVGARLGFDDPRVVISILFQGYAARIWSPTLACVVTGGVLPDLDRSRLRWRYPEGAPVDLLLEPVTGSFTSDPHEVYAAVAPHLASVIADVHDQVAISERLLWGNAASALSGAARALGKDAADLAGAVLDIGRLRGTMVDDMRRSCCLFYRIPNGGTCGDCVLRLR